MNVNLNIRGVLQRVIERRPVSVGWLGRQLTSAVMRFLFHVHELSAVLLEITQLMALRMLVLPFPLGAWMSTSPRCIGKCQVCVSSQQRKFDTVTEMYGSVGRGVGGLLGVDGVDGTD